MQAYKSITGQVYEIIGWFGDSLQTKTGRHVFTLTRQHTLNLLQYLGLKESDIPRRTKS